MAFVRPRRPKPQWRRVAEMLTPERKRSGNLNTGLAVEGKVVAILLKVIKNRPRTKVPLTAARQIWTPLAGP